MAKLLLENADELVEAATEYASAPAWLRLLYSYIDAYAEFETELHRVGVAFQFHTSAYGNSNFGPLAGIAKAKPVWPN